MSLCVGDVLVGAEFIPGVDMSQPTGEMLLDGKWTHVKFDVGAHFLIVGEELIENSEQLMIDCVSLENAYEFQLRTTLDLLLSTCEIVSRESNLQ